MQMTHQLRCLTDDFAYHHAQALIHVASVSTQRQPNVQQVERKCANVSNCEVIEQVTPPCSCAEHFGHVGQQHMLKHGVDDTDEQQPHSARLSRRSKRLR